MGNDDCDMGLLTAQTQVPLHARPTAASRGPPDASPRGAGKARPPSWDRAGDDTGQQPQEQRGRGPGWPGGPRPAGRPGGAVRRRHRAASKPQGPRSPRYHAGTESARPLSPTSSGCRGCRPPGHAVRGPHHVTQAACLLDTRRDAPGTEATGRDGVTGVVPARICRAVPHSCLRSPLPAGGLRPSHLSGGWGVPCSGPAGDPG